MESVSNESFAIKCDFAALFGCEPSSPLSQYQINQLAAIFIKQYIKDPAVIDRFLLQIPSVFAAKQIAAACLDLICDKFANKRLSMEDIIYESVDDCKYIAEYSTLYAQIYCALGLVSATANSSYSKYFACSKLPAAQYNPALFRQCNIEDQIVAYLRSMGDHSNKIGEKAANGIIDLIEESRDFDADEASSTCDFLENQYFAFEGGDDVALAIIDALIKKSQNSSIINDNKGGKYAP